MNNADAKKTRRKKPTGGTGHELPGFNIVHIKAALLSFLALSISAVILVLSFALSAPFLHPGLQQSVNKNSVEARLFRGMDFTTAIGGSESHSDHITINRLEDSRALVVIKTRFEAAEYPFIKVRANSKRPDLDRYLIWRSSTEPNSLAHIRLRNSGEITTLLMADHKAWRGEITDIGIDTYADKSQELLDIYDVTALPYSSKALISAVLTDWNAFEAWNQSSINHLPGVKQSELLSLILVLASWAFLAAILITLFSRITATPHPAVYLIILSVPWLALDLTWQGNLTEQLEVTSNQFKGKTQHEKQLVDMDGDLYKYIDRLKKTVLPRTPSRVYLLHQSSLKEGHNYFRLRAQYHLLPHNVFNYGRTPHKKYSLPGDFILALGELGHLKFLPDNHVLVWGDDLSIPVKVIDEDTLGTLYQVLPQAGADI